MDAKSLSSMAPPQVECFYVTDSLRTWLQAFVVTISRDRAALCYEYSFALIAIPVDRSRTGLPGTSSRYPHV